jgi:hypothetical protein
MHSQLSLQLSNLHLLGSQLQSSTSSQLCQLLLGNQEQPGDHKSGSNQATWKAETELDALCVTVHGKFCCTMMVKFTVIKGCGQHAACAPGASAPSPLLLLQWLQNVLLHHLLLLRPRALLLLTARSSEPASDCCTADVTPQAPEQQDIIHDIHMHSGDAHCTAVQL